MRDLSALATAKKTRIPIPASNWINSGVRPIQGAAKKRNPLKFFALFSATVWDFNVEFHSCI